MTDQVSLLNAIQESQPDEVYNLASQSFVQTSWKQPVFSAEVNAIGTLKLLEAIRKIKPSAKFYQASTSELFGNSEQDFQNENTKFKPRSPYAISKLFAHWASINYRESYNMFVSCGILFNHESPRRGIEFVTRKISDGVARIHLGLSNSLSLGNLDAKRDWSFAGDYVNAIWKILQLDEPDNFVISTGETHSVREFVINAFEHIGINNWEKYIKQDSRYMRPADLHTLKGDYSRAKKILNWEPKVTFKQLIVMMVNEDIKRLQDKK